MRRTYVDACHVESSGFTWQVLFPDNQRAALGSSRPKAKINIEGEILTLPLVVAKKLEDACRDESFHPLDRRVLVEKIKAVSLSCAKQKIVKLASQREYSEAELSRKLGLEGYWRQTIDEAVQAAKRGRVLDDERFAEMFIRSKLSAGWGMRKIEYELERKGVDPATVTGWPDAFVEGVSESERAFELVRYRSIPSKNPFEKTMRFLVNKGFSYAAARDAAERLLHEDGDF